MLNNVPNFNPAAVETESAAAEETFINYAFTRLDTIMPVKVFSLIEGNSAFVNVIPVQLTQTTGGEQLPNGADDVICNVPVMMLYGKNCRITFEIQVGDYGLLLAAKRDISSYKISHEETIPPTRRIFSFSDGFFVPLDFKNVGNGVIVQNNQSKITISDGAITVDANGTLTINCTDATLNATGPVNIKGSSVNLGNEGGQPVARVGDSVVVGGISGTITSGSEIVKSA